MNWVLAITDLHTKLSLDNLRPGERARITDLAGEAAITVRLLEMGVLVGETAQCIGVAPLGDPITIQLRGGRLAIRRRDAALVKVEVLDDNE